MTVTDEDMKLLLAGEDPVLYNALARNGYTVERLAGLGTEYTSASTWHDIHDIPNIGPARLLALVNFFRREGDELPWFAGFDEFSANWTALRGRERVPAPKC